MNKKIKAEATKRGLAALWEEGGACSGYGTARVITKPDGSKQRPMYKPSEKTPNGKHALLVVYPNHYVIDVQQEDGNFLITVYQVVSVEKTGEQFDVELMGKYQFVNNNWDRFPNSKLVEAINAAKRKSQIENCVVCVYTEFILR